MNILVLNGSPKGQNSITLQTTNYLKILHPEHEFSVLDVGQKIKALEKDFSSAAEEIRKAELIIFSYPVYTFVAPCQLHRFIELLKKEKLDLSQKYATQISTSKHFYDITAHRYIKDNCFDLGLKYIKGLSADMDDLSTEQGQKEAEDFFDFVIFNTENDLYEKAIKLNSLPELYKADVIECDDEKSGDVVIVTDCDENDEALKNMITRFRARCTERTRIVNIGEYPFKGGCLGCFNCAVSGKCVYKDNFDEFLRNNIQKANSIIYAFTIKDHSMGARFKMYDDRQFCNGHRTVTIGMPVGYIVNGNLSVEENLKTIIEARAEVGHNYLCGIATNEENANESIDKLAKALDYALKKKLLLPRNFYGIGGMKVFRDLIWIMQGMMKADHKFYKSHNQYDFPQKQWKRMMLMYLVGGMLSSEKMKSKMGNKMNEGMLMPYQKALENAKKRMNK
ncbi:MAG: NAD(P)H-dependent oxidoreductase [Clostridia bacterium]|nr:NAD(P)H-dependent oxidoreductase [Clostridia bacterium]